MGGTIGTDTTWTLSGSPYIVTSAITVKGTDGADGITTLTIEPGVELRFNSNLQLNVGASSGDPGALKAQGTAADPIIFTSNQASPAPGNWRGIKFYTTTEDDLSELSHCIVEYAGYGNQGQVYIYNAAPSLNNCTFINSSNYDLYYAGTVSGAVSGCTLNSGIYLMATSTVDFNGNTFNQNNSYPTKTYADHVSAVVSGNTFSNLDGTSYLEVNSDTIEHDASWSSAIPYKIVGNVTIKGTDGADAVTTLTIEPGAELLFNSNLQLNVGASSGDPGALIAQGTVADPIIFTSSQSTPAPGNWRGIKFYNTTEDDLSELSHCIVEYAGYGNQGLVYLCNARPSITYSTFRYSSHAGIYAFGSGCDNAEITGNTFSDNIYGVYCTSNAFPLIHQNNFIGNSSYGVYNSSSAAVDAENNWWGDSAGPNAEGDATYGNVDADPWLTEEYQVDGTLNLSDLIITALATNPAGNLQSGQTVTLTASIQNNGSVSVAESFAVDFKVNGTSIGTATVNDTVAVGGTVQASQNWDYTGGNPTIEVHANSQADVAESDDTNNSFTAALFDISDNTAPALVSASPANGEQLTQLDQIVVTLSEDRSAVDDASVTASFSLVDGSQQNISGTVSEDNDTFTFVPETLPLATGTYQVNLIAADTHGNTQNIEFSFALVAEPTPVGGTISTDTTWSLDGSPYIVTSDITIQGTDGGDGITTLTIEPGVTVKFDIGRSLTVGTASGDPGALAAQGTAANPITFTSNQASPAPGNWHYILFYNTADDATTVMEHCVVEYGGYSSGGSLYAHQASPTFRNVTIRNSKTYGAYLYTAEPTIENCTFSGNQNYDLYYIGTVGGSVIGSTINSGIYLVATGTVNFSGNTINQNNALPIRAYPDNVGEISASTFNNVDTASFMEINVGTVSRDATWTAAIPYAITGNITVKGTDGTDGITTLTIEPGATVKFGTGMSLTVGAASEDPGALVAQGTAANPVTFTSNQATPAAGDWNGIQIFNTSDDAATRLEHCVVAYTGKYGYNFTPAIEITDAAPTLTNCRFIDSYYYDLWYSGTVGGTVSGCTLNSGISLLATSSVDFTGNTFNHNSTYPTRANADDVHSLVNGNTFNNLNAGSYLEVNSGTVSLDAVWTKAIPLYIQGDLTIQGTDGADGITTLTIEPGAKLKFGSLKHLNIGAATGDPGALIAQGTADDMILLSSYGPTPEPGDWYGILFDATASESSILDFCVIEYGGHYGISSIYLNDRNVSVLNSIIRNNAGEALYVKGANGDNVNIRCNTFEDNYTGIYVTGALPNIELNNFINNTYCGLWSNGSIIKAENNWWNDAAGPNQSGDKTIGDVDTDPWSTQANQCSSSGANTAPYTPTDPSPADNAVRVSSSTSITLTWTGGDPDPQDTVVYDIYIGTTADTLALDGQGVVGASHVINNPTPGITYYWQVKARDNHGEVVTGPVWRFTANGDHPDLTIGNVVTDPSGHIQAGQDVTITATVQNSGTGPMVDSFVVDFKVDGSSIGTPAVTEIMLAGQSVLLSVPWSYSGGNPTIEIQADSQSAVVETDEQNNRFTALLNDVADMTAPAVTNTTPASGAFLQQVNSIAVTLDDTQSAVDDAAVIAGVSVTDSSQQSVPGVVTETNDTFTFAPSTVPMADGTYTVSLVAADIHANTQNYSFSFTVDSQPPEKPVITGGTVSSGTIQARPMQNTSEQFVVQLTGTREADTSVLINGTEHVGLGDSPWSVEINLQTGNNALEVWLKDRVGNQGDAEWVDIFAATADTVYIDYDASGRLKRIDTTP